MKKNLASLILLLLVISSHAQDAKTDKVSFTISWTPIYYGPNDGKFRLDAIIPLALETNVSYNFKKLSLMSGAGIQDWLQTSGDLVSLHSSPVHTQNMQRITLRLPFQFNYVLSNSQTGIIPYARLEFVNEFGFNKSLLYIDGIYNKSVKYNDYLLSANLGYGTLFSLNKSIKLVTELSLGTYLNEGSFNSYHIKFKIGIMI